MLSGAEDIWMAERVMVNCEFCVLVERTLVRRCVSGETRPHFWSLWTPRIAETLNRFSRSLLVTSTISKMHGEPAIAHLFAALEGHAISISKDDVLPIFASPKTKGNAIAWIDEYLDPSTFLSKEELDL